MTTLIFIENVLGSGQMVKLTEDFGDRTVSRDLTPGEHARLVVSPFKSVMVEETSLAQFPSGPPNDATNRGTVVPFPARLTLARQGAPRRRLPGHGRKTTNP